MGISAVINTRNAEEHLDRVLESLKDFDEIVVCDMESTDSTVEIARRHGARVITFPKGNHTCAEPARNTAIQAASSEWVLMIDADELVSSELREYLYDFITHSGETAGLWIPRRNYYFGKWNQVTYPDYQLRFFKRDGTDWPPLVHTFPVVNGPTEYIPKEHTELALSHYPASVVSQIDRINRYTTGELAKRGIHRVTLWQLWWEPWWRFFKAYILKGGWHRGIEGYISAKNDSIYRHFRLVKTYEKYQEGLQQSRQDDDLTQKAH